MLRLLLVLPGTTDYDQQKRIKGSLDMPLNREGFHEVEQTVAALGGQWIDVIYSSPCQAAVQTAEQLSRNGEIRVKITYELRNLDRGLWSGKTVDEMKSRQPTIYRQWLENPESISPPGGETIAEARQRITKFVKKLRRKHRDGVVAMVVSEPFVSIIRMVVHARESMGNLWEVECGKGGWEWIDVPAELSV